MLPGNIWNLARDTPAAALMEMISQESPMLLPGRGDGNTELISRCDGWSLAAVAILATSAADVRSMTSMLRSLIHTRNRDGRRINGRATVGLAAVQEFCCLLLTYMDLYSMGWIQNRPAGALFRRLSSK